MYGYLCQGGAHCTHGTDSTHWVEEEEAVCVDCGSNESITCLCRRCRQCCPGHAPVRSDGSCPTCLGGNYVVSCGDTRSALAFNRGWTYGQCPSCGRQPTRHKSGEVHGA